MIEGVGIWVLRFPTPGCLEALLVRRATYPYRGEWFAVDGVLESHESPETAARRELAEETSLTPRLLLKDGASPTRIATVRGVVRLHGFVAFVGPESRPTLNSEHTDSAWYGIETALELVPLPSQRATLRRAIERIEAHDADGILEGTSAEQVEHPGGNLRDHLERTAELLADFDSHPALCTAGLLHAAYGTDGFAQALLPLADRPLLEGLVGEEAERLVYLYAACDRRCFYESLLDGRTDYRDRFCGTRRSLSPGEVRDLVELTFANELDLAHHDKSFRTRHGAVLVPLFRRCQRWASGRAYLCFSKTFEVDGPFREGPAT